MSIQFRFGKEKAIQIVLYLASKKGSIDFHRLFKILYFADKEHLYSWGRPILGDTYIAMQMGPVPSNLYDLLKVGRGDLDSFLGMGKSDIQKYFDVNQYYITSKCSPNLDTLSETERELLDKHFEENKDKAFNQLAEEFHDEAWQKASQNFEISYEDIISESGNAKDLLEFVKNNLETEQAIETR